MWNQLQDLHPKTLYTIFLLLASSKTESKGGAALRLAKKFAQEIETMEGIALHIKIEKRHQDNILNEIKVGFPQMDDIKTLLMPRQQAQHVLKRIDLTNSMSV